MHSRGIRQSNVHAQLDNKKPAQSFFGTHASQSGIQKGISDYIHREENLIGPTRIFRQFQTFARIICN